MDENVFTLSIGDHVALQSSHLLWHNVAKQSFGISISEWLYLFSLTPSGAPNGSPALPDLPEGHGGGPGVVGDEQH